MKIPETLSTKSVIIGFLIFILLLGGSIGAFLIEEHENDGDREGNNSGKEMEDRGYTQSDFRYSSEKQDSDMGDAQSDNNDAHDQESELQNTGSLLPENISKTSIPASSLTGATGSLTSPTPNK